MPKDSVIIYHNPRCSKSRATLTLLESMGIEPEVVRYLDSPPDSETLKQITRSLDCSVRDLLRKGESCYRELEIENRDLDEEALIALVGEYPVLLERPIVVRGSRAAIGRPPENVLALFNTEDVSRS